MEEICRGQAADSDEIIDFINYVFSQNGGPLDFKKCLPKIYENSFDFTKYHYLIKENGKIKATVCAMPLEYDVLGQKLKAFGIGMVSVHPYSRKKGYMKTFMQAAMDDIKNECAFAFLGGQRQRYQYFGFELAGTKLDFEVTKTNIRHTYENLDCKDISIIPLEEGPLCEKAYLLHREQPVYALRKKEDFLSILRSWESRPFAMLYKGEFCGYACVDPNGIVNEFILNNDELYPHFIKCLSETLNRNALYFNAFPHEKAKLSSLICVAETAKAANCENFRVFDWAATINAFLRFKAEYEIIENGDLTIEIENNSYRISVLDKNINVKKNDEKAEISLSGLQATTLLFSFSGEYIKNIYYKTLSEEKRILLKSWFPLPLPISAVDAC